MACSLFGDQLLPELMLTYCQLGPYDQTLGKFESKEQNVFVKMYLKMPSVKWRPFSPRGEELTSIMFVSLSKLLPMNCGLMKYNLKLKQM